MRLHYSDSELLRGIREKNEKCIKYICKDFIPVVRAYVQRNSGNPQDVEDIIQDALIILYLQCNNPAFILTSKMKTYFFGIGKNLWLQRLERNHQLKFYADFEVMERAGDYEHGDPEFSEVQLARTRLYLEHMSTLPKECKMILALYSEKKSMAEIAGILGYKDEDSAKSRKYACKTMLVKRITNDPRFKKLMDYDRL